MFFDLDGTFICRKVNVKNSDPVVLDDTVLQQIYVSETDTADIKSVRNVTKVFGKCIVLLNNSLLSTTSDNVDGAYVVKLKANSLKLASNYFNKNNYTVGWQIIEFR